MNKLYIDTRDNKRIVVRINKEDKQYSKESPAFKSQAQALLPLIEHVHKDAGIKSSEIEEIEVETGPGSYTGLKVGVAVANAFSFANSVKVNGKPIGEIELPNY